MRGLTLPSFAIDNAKIGGVKYRRGEGFARFRFCMERWERPMESALTAEERYFLDEYVVPNRRERLGWELERERRRADGLWRFAHGARELLKPARVHPVRIQGGRFVLDRRDFLREVGNPQVRVLHPSKEWDRARMSFREAIDRFLGRGPYIAVDSRRTFAFIETESGCEGHEFLYLHP